MDFSHSPKVEALRADSRRFFEDLIYPAEARYQHEIEEHRRAGNPWQTSQVIEALKPEAQRRGFWNPFLPYSERAPQGLSNREYAPLCEIMGRVPWAAQVFNCSAPDTGNMEILERFTTPEQQLRRLDPLLAGEIRSAFLMTEPNVTSSDASNIRCSIRRYGDEYVIDGDKWFSSGAGDPRCALYIVMGRTDPAAKPGKQQSMVLVPASTPGIEVLRAVQVFGYDGALHGHMDIRLLGERVPVENLLLGAGRGFEIAQMSTRTRPHPPLHAHPRPGRARAGTAVPARAVAGGVRQADQRSQRVARADRRIALPDRVGTAADPEGRGRPRT
ncbi:acyl-CoA dehydrogenase family protein [Rhodanobacter thiooxydans]|uniref:acyl-CoA dehydrogenase family protein n=2 Tax=Rhodanobacter TaxID=75309 RepID=UPI00041B2531|nr:acyl-CoA dehydrogenase family protein [Rhodanobacter thiooxydans]